MKNLLLITGCLMMGLSCSAKKNENGVFTRIKTAEAMKLVSANQGNKEFIIIDVRRLDEYKESRIEGAINIDYSSPKFDEQISKLNKNKKYFIYCRSGNRSANALKRMEALKFKEVYELDGGLIDWSKNGGPVIK